MKRSLLIIWLVAVGIMTSGCAAVKLGNIPKPAETVKLRVAVIPISAELIRGKWGISAEKFAEDQYRIVSKRLNLLGYYEVVPEAELKAVIGGYTPERWTLTRNNAELAVQIGKALYADYVLLADRGSHLGDPHYYFEVILINIRSGKHFGVRINNTRKQGERYLPAGAGKIAMSELFRDAKEDLLTTALRKTRRVKDPDSETPKPVRRKPRQPGTGNGADRQQLDKGDEKATDSRDVQYQDAERSETQELSGAKRLIVYDLVTASDIYRPMALILSEAIREEIQNRGQYNLVNRENIQLHLNEMKLQQSDLVDREHASQLGKVAGAQEFVTGNLGTLGHTLILQSKRTDIQTMLNLSLASLKSEVGEEDILLSRLAELVDKLLQQKQPAK